jgi:hypothetical protein
MSHDPPENELDAPLRGLEQNPAPYPVEGQALQDQKRLLVEEIMAAFRAVLPSNYVAATNGPWYSLQFQAMAEQLADIQLSEAEVLKDSYWDFTRPEFLWEVLGQYVFPMADSRGGVPQIDGDLAYRDFLHKMVDALLQGATSGSIKAGLEAIDPTVTVTIMERYLETPPRDPDGGYTIDDQFFMDIYVEGAGGGFPDDPFAYQQNAAIVKRALKPAHVLCELGYLFRDSFDQIADDTDGLTWELDDYHYDDLRKWCEGAQAIISTGSTLSNRFYFSDPTVSFENIQAGAVLKILSGDNQGHYRVVEVLSLISGASTIPATYTTSPGGGSGTLTAISAQDVEDSSQDWGTFGDGEQLTITSGVNAGTYRLKSVLGLNGGPMGQSGISGTQARLAPTVLRLNRRMPAALTGQSYELTVDRLGVRVPKTVTAEDVTEQFYL